MQTGAELTFHTKATSNYQIYTSPNKDVILYVRKVRLTKTPPDALVAMWRTSTLEDLAVFADDAGPGDDD